MASQESTVFGPNRLDLFLGRAGASLSKIFLKRVIYQGPENIQKINERLGLNGSVLLVSDHPGTLETIYTAGLVLLMTNRKESGVILKEAFVNGEMGLVGRTAINILRKHGVEPIAVKTPKYEKDSDIRHDYNAIPVRHCLRILHADGGLLLTFASGTRSEDMLEAEPGLNLFSSSADVVVPLTTVMEKNKKPIIVVHEPIPGKSGVKWCINRFGKIEGRQVFTDLIMTMIASGQPDEKKQGFYQEFCRQLEMVQQGGMVSQREQTDNLRIQRLIKTYIAWKKGEF